MLIRKPLDIKPSEITTEGAYRNRRQFIRAAGVLGAGVALPMPARANLPPEAMHIS
jgi:sulfoxide reductase catalytic subunit YedY